MSEPQAFKGDYVDLKFIKTRKVAQVHIEIAIEDAAKFVAAFGAPNPASGIPIAMARIDLSAKPEKPKGGKLAQRAGILCNEGAMVKFLEEKHQYHIATEIGCAAAIREICGVASRADLDHNDAAARIFKDLEASYRAWLSVAA